MDRIAELMAKGVDNLDADELAELKDLLHAEADARLDSDDSTDDTVLGELEEIAAHLDAVKAEEARRETEASERAEKKAALAGRIRGEADGGDDADEGAPEPETAEEEPPAEEPEADEPEAVEEKVLVDAVTADAAPKPRISRVAARRPEHTSPVRRNQPRKQAALVASANVPGVQGGDRLNDPSKLAAAFTAAAELAASSQTKIKLPVATLRGDIPEELQLDRDAVRNEAKIAARTGLPALTASGGICAPVPYRYDLPTVGDDSRPVREALARFGAVRGGIRTLVPPTITDVDGEAGPIGIWTEANDQNPSSPTTKPYLTIACDDDENTTKVYAITRSFKIGNFRDKWYPEQVNAYLDLANTWQARYADAKLLQAVSAGSKVVTHGQLLGSAQDVFTALRQLFAGIRFRHRIARSQTFRVIGFEWVRDNIITDLVRKGPGDATLEERLVMAETQVDAFFRGQGANISWSPDYEWGRAIGQTGGPLSTTTQGVGAVVGYPSVARFYVHLEGSWLFLDGGSLDLGVIRDATLVGTNDMLMFAETFEAAHYHGLPGESYVYDIDICANGGIASALDINPCVSGS